MGFLGCYKDEERGQYATDHMAPQPISAPAVQNLPGAAIITYSIPGDEDLLYVKATYTLDNGEIVEQKASAYTNSLKIEGIGRSREVPVTLVAGDRSKNESTPVVVTAHPLDAHIYTVFQTVEVVPDFGGIRLFWENPNAADMVVSVTTTDDYGSKVTAENFYTQARQGEGTVRGYASTERLFGVSIRDRWGNGTDTLWNTFTPRFEQRIDRSLFRRWNPVGIPYTHYHDNYSIEKLWDEDPASRFLFFLAQGYPASFTFDIGQKAVFSRFRAFMEPGQLFAGQSIETFEMWGSDSPDVTDAFGSGWHKLGEYRFTRPSEQGGSAQEDQSAGIAGEDFGVDPSVPPVRYIRVVVTKTWGNSPYATLGDLRFWGQVAE